MPQNITERTKIYTDKGYDSKANRPLFQHKVLSDGIMRKAHRDHALTEEDKA
ncbi:hypothetical protein [Neisseria weixii]|uniref:hypothetical protein n=1 Tax=Neisseria weixii TaxID=1853276 RepID=UPI0035A0336B